MTPSFSRVWKEIGVANWAWDTRSILMIPRQRPSLVLLRNAKGIQPRADPGLVISRIDKAGVPVQLVVTTCEHALDLRLKLEVPVVWLAPADDPRAAGPLAVPLPGGRGSLICHDRHPADVATVRDLLARLDGSLDLTEPFARVREAVAEARKMGR